MLVLQIAAATTWQTVISRVLAAKDAATAQRMYRRTSFYFVGRFLLPGLWGAAAFVYFAQQGGLPEGITSLTAMPQYLGGVILPVGFIGLVIAAMLAAEMSTDSGYLLTWATVIYNDFITPCLQNPSRPRVGCSSPGCWSWASASSSFSTVSGMSYPATPGITSP